MPTKALTILIADEQHLQRLHLEKMLNQLGYYRIVPVQTFDEVLILTDIPAEPFDVLIIHAGLAASAGDALAFQQVRHVLVYDDQHSGAPASQAMIRLPGSPDSLTLEHFMGIIDPPSPVSGLRVVPWLRDLARSPAV